LGPEIFRRISQNAAKFKSEQDGFLGTAGRIGDPATYESGPAAMAIRFVAHKVRVALGGRTLGTAKPGRQIDEKTYSVWIGSTLGSGSDF
jgi:hypothetical protein